MTSRYTVLFDLASGGMGSVSVALLRGERGFRRTVAVKRINAQLARDPQFYEMLAREARLSSQIEDPGVVQVHELVQQDGELMIAMELVQGVSLRDITRAAEQANELLPIPECVRILAKCARALHAAHSATDEVGGPLGIVHRDVSPQNILISFRGSVKVTDFGIAKAISGDEQTRSTSVRGKPSYLAPEQSSGAQVDARSDVWSLGVVAFELISGQRLFRGRNDLETLHMLMQAKIPRIDSVRPDVSPELADVIERCLQRDPAARFEDAQALARALEACTPGDRGASREDVAALVARWAQGREVELGDRIARALAEQPKQQAEAAPPVFRPRRFGAIAAAGFALSFGLSVGFAPRAPAADRTAAMSTTAPRTAAAQGAAPSPVAAAAAPAQAGVAQPSSAVQAPAFDPESGDQVAPSTPAAGIDVATIAQGGERRRGRDRRGASAVPAAPPMVLASPGQPEQPRATAPAAQAVTVTPPPRPAVVAPILARPQTPPPTAPAPAGSDRQRFIEEFPL